MGVLAVVAMLGVVSGCAGSPDPEPQTPTQQRTSPVLEPPSRIFGAPPDNPFLVDVSGASLSPKSAGQMVNLHSQLAENKGIAIINTREYNISYYIAEPGTPTTRVGFDDCQRKGSVPADLHDGAAHFEEVPIPADAEPAKGTDRHLAVWSKESGKLWEFWMANHSPDGSWTACWGGRIDEPRSSRGAFPEPFGASASGLATVGSMITLDEARAGHIDHAVAVALPTIGVDAKTVPPATRSDGTDASPNAIPMGARLRLDPKLDVDSLRVTPFAKAVARAAQRYGFIVTETSGRVAVTIEGSSRVRGSSSGNPWDAILGSTPDYFQLKDFPWRDVEVVMMQPPKTS